MSIVFTCRAREGEGEGRGSHWVGELGELDGHLNKNPPEVTQMNGCHYTEIKCKLCNDPFKRSLNVLEDHQYNHCPKRQYACPHCRYRSIYIEITEYHLKVCPRAQTECPHCKKLLNVLKSSTISRRSVPLY